MAIVSMSCYSKALCRPTEIRLALPVDVRPGAPRCEASYARPPKLMVLLHGYTGSCNDYLYSSPMHDLAQRFNLVIACPSGENSFYLNQPVLAALMGTTWEMNWCACCVMHIEWTMRRAAR